MPAIFFDRDGVINSLVSRPDGRKTSPWRVEEFIFLPRVREAFALVHPTYQCFVVTNQPHVGLDMSEDDLSRIHSYLQQNVPQITEITYCATQGSDYYKPAPGMINYLMAKYKLHPGPHHYLIGDRWKDIACGFAAGVQTIGVGDNFIETKYKHEGWDVQPDYHVTDIYAACELIMERYHAKSRTDRSE